MSASVVQMLQNMMTNLRRHGIEFFGRYYSVYPGKVVSIDDPQFQGRIKVDVPAVATTPLSALAYPLFPPGFFDPPVVGGTVDVSFEGGDLRFPRYVGDWIKRGQLPSEFRQNPPTKRFWKSPSGHLFIFDDTQGSEEVEVRHKNGSSRLTLKSNGDVEVNADANKVKIGNVTVGTLLDNLAKKKSMSAGDGHVHVTSQGLTSGALGPGGVGDASIIPTFVTAETEAS